MPFDLRAPGILFARADGASRVLCTSAGGAACIALLEANLAPGLALTLVYGTPQQKG